MAMDVCQTRKYSSFDSNSTVCPAFLDKLHMCLCTGTFSDTCSLMIRHHDTDVLPMTACTSAASCPGLRSPEKAKSDSGSRQRGREGGCRSPVTATATRTLAVLLLSDLCCTGSTHTEKVLVLW